MPLFVFFVCFLIPSVQGRQDASEADLERASAGRTVRVRIVTSEKADVVVLPAEVYVARVLAAEGEPRAGAAAQEALAIAIRTFAVTNVGRHRRDGFDLCDKTHCQVLRPSTPASRLAALTTASQLLTLEGRPVAVFYSASCGGRSEAPSQVWPGAIDVPYLRAAEDAVHAAEETWVVAMPMTRVEQALRRAGFEGRALRDLDVRQRSSSGRVTLIRLEGLRPNEITGEDFRAAIGARELRSTQFAVERDGETFRFTGRGYGHGVGMCVIGAGRRAARGESAAQILQQVLSGAPGSARHVVGSWSRCGARPGTRADRGAGQPGSAPGSPRSARARRLVGDPRDCVSAADPRRAVRIG